MVPRRFGTGTRSNSRSSFNIGTGCHLSSSRRDVMVRVDGQGNGNSLVRVRGLDKKYQRGSEEIHVLQGLNLDVDAGDFVAFMGPSGSGKTTLLNLLGGLDLP